jgi:hypothetical protein
MNFTAVAQRELSSLQQQIEQRACPDQYFGRVSALARTGCLSERSSTSARPIDEPCLILILESPHLAEFKGEPGPAKGTTGRNIATHICNVPGLEHFHEHGLILMNAVQYQCSLGFGTERFRDRVFTNMWRAGGRENFVSRLIGLHRPTDTLVNCCTKGKCSSASSELRVLVQLAIQEACPTTSVLRRNHPSFWHFTANREREWRFNEVG